MPIATPDLAIPLRTALLNSSDISGQLAVYRDNDAIFTRRPAPVPPDGYTNGVDKPLIMISGDLALIDDAGYLDAEHNIHTRDITVYGSNATTDDYRKVEELARAIRDVFHRAPDAITVPDWTVLQIWAIGPHPAPDDDDMIVARVVTLQIQLLARLG
jgi:hypothetical protein